MDAHLPEIPLIRLDSANSYELVERTWPQTPQLMRDVMRTHWALPIAVVLGDGMSRRWLVRHDNPFLPDIARTAKAVGRRGGYFFNICYEWACSTSVAPDPAGKGPRMIRVLDWELKGMGYHQVVAEQRGPAGAYYNLTWPGYAGVVTGMAPGRFAAAINQGPRRPIYKNFWLNEIAARWTMLRAKPGSIPATHLLRIAFETATNFSEAVAQLMDTSRRIATPAIFILSGVRANEAAIVEAVDNERRRHDLGNAPIGAANAWISSDLEGVALPPAREWAGKVTPEQDSANRRAGACRLQDGPFTGAQSLPVPVLNSRTVMIAEMNAATGRLMVEALDSPAPGTLPHVVGRREIA
jgi:hypothetical protein